MNEKADANAYLDTFDEFKQVCRERGEEYTTHEEILLWQGLISITMTAELVAANTRSR